MKTQEEIIKEIDILLHDEIDSMQLDSKVPFTCDNSRLEKAHGLLHELAYLTSKQFPKDSELSDEEIDEKSCEIIHKWKPEFDKVIHDEESDKKALPIIIMCMRDVAKWAREKLYNLPPQPVKGAEEAWKEVREELIKELERKGKFHTLVDDENEEHTCMLKDDVIKLLQSVAKPSISKDKLVEIIDEIVYAYNYSTDKGNRALANELATAILTELNK